MLRRRFWSPETSARSETCILGNSPNPFNPTTEISFRLAATGKTRIDVFSLTGQRVRKLVARKMRVGRHTTSWNGLDSNGRHVASGVYFVRMTTMESIQTHRVLLMR
ncbi:MAG: FlgD immunoglobulin-like domain containing protein [Candidatus Latescibacteria bacterium]|nr:FlgD immunoglobulin-like domain containing protein [Candidatus Latescibacterota bacterium]